ncbi:uncharacterized protein LOC129296234 [Prosopis cineraria]|uniref:uncharacterized protein LOC129296234 n=1 Tax=Prosopis cineraria TaxID=364024 RepID=UPI0024102353|nr:uncharacterized protein LOC129296234 [Prosopis cineraria]
MALQSSAPDGDGKADRFTVFIDTSLDTHLAMIAYDADTVSDLKKRIMLEHPLCFPKIGQIKIHAIKVKRRGYFYHLADSMLVRSAFSGFKKTWFLSMDASAVTENEKTQISISPDSSNQIACHGIATNASIGAIDIPPSHPSKRASDFNCFKLPQLENGHGEKEVSCVSPRVSEHSGKGFVDNLETVVKLSGTDDTVIPSTGSIPGCQGDGFSKGNKDETNLYDERTLKSLSSAKKKCKGIGGKEGTVWDDVCKDNNASVLGTGISMAEQEGNLVPENPSENASRDELGGNLKNTRSVVQMSNDAVKETEAPKEQSECRNNGKENINAEYDKSRTAPSEHASTVNKKHKKRKRSLTHDLEDKMQKVEGASQQAEVHKSDEEQKKIEEPKEYVETNHDKSEGMIEFQHDMVSQEPSDAGSPAKKKRKGKERSGYESALKEERSLVGDSNKESLRPENACQHSLEDLPKIKDSSAGQPTEQCGDADPLRTSVIGSKRKRKKNSSNNQTATSTSSRNGDAEDSRLYGVQEEILKDGQISKDNSASKNAGDNFEVVTNTSKEVTMYKVKRTGNSKDHCSIDVGINPSDLDETRELTESNGLHMDENIDLDNCHVSEAGQTVLAEEGRKLPPLDDPKHLLSENCMTSNQNNAHANIRELSETSEVPKANETTECGKSEKKRRKKRKAKDADGGSLLTEDFSHVDASKSDTVLMESYQATNDDPTFADTMKEESLLNQTEGKEVPPEQIKGTSDIDKEVNDINVGSMENISKTEARAENPSEKRSKKAKKKQTPTAKDVSEMLTKDQVLDCKEPSPACEATMELRSKKKKKSKSTSTKSTNKSSGPILEPVGDVETEPPHSPSNAPKGNHKSPSGAKETDINSVSSFGHEDDNHLKAPTKTEMINAEQHISSGQEQHKDIVSDDILVDKNGADRTDIEPMPGKNRKVHDVMKGNTHVGKLRSTKQLLSTVGNGLGINPDEKVPKARRTRQEAYLSSQSNSFTSTIEENKRPQDNKSSGESMNLEKNSEVFPVSNSKLKALKKTVQTKVGKASRNNIQGVVGKKEQKKSLLAGTIFKDDSSGTSDDKDEEVNDSSSSTRSPSDASLSPDYSHDDSDAGSHGGTGLENGGESRIEESRLSVKKGMPIDSILRSSRRYKKAKLTASQFEESENQPVDFVPDSLADM